MSHAEVLIGQLGSGEKDRWQEALKHPFPKLLSGYEMAYKVEGGLDTSATKVEELIGEKWAEKMALADGSQPVSGRIYTHISAPYFQEMAQDKENFDEMKKMQRELHSLGVFAAYGSREAFDNSPQARERNKGQPEVLTQHYLFLPHMKPKDDEAEKTGTKWDELKTERDIEGAATMLAYLLAKGLVKEEDIPKQDVVNGQMVHSAFSSGDLIRAKSPSIQKKLEALPSLHGEERQR